MNERRHWSHIAEDLPEELSPIARKSIGLAIEQGKITGPEDLRRMSDLEIRWGVRGAGQAHGIGPKTLENVRSVYPRMQ